MIITYGALYGYMRFLNTSNPELNACIPTIGFTLSTWSLRIVQVFWTRLKQCDCCRDKDENEFRSQLAPSPDARHADMC